MSKSAKRERKKAKKFVKSIEKLRKKIDLADRAVLKALGARMKTVSQIGKLKIKHGVPPLQKARWASVMEKRAAQGKRAGLSSQFTQKIYRIIHQEALKLQWELMKRRSKK